MRWFRRNNNPTEFVQAIIGDEIAKVTLSTRTDEVMVKNLSKPEAFDLIHKLYTGEGIDMRMVDRGHHPGNDWLMKNFV